MLKQKLHFLEVWKTKKKKNKDRTKYQTGKNSQRGIVSVITVVLWVFALSRLETLDSPFVYLMHQSKYGYGAPAASALDAYLPLFYNTGHRSARAWRMEMHRGFGLAYSLDFTQDLLFFDSLMGSIEECTELAYINLLADLFVFGRIQSETYLGPGNLPAERQALYEQMISRKSLACKAKKVETSLVHASDPYLWVTAVG